MESNPLLKISSVTFWVGGTVKGFKSYPVFEYIMVGFFFIFLLDSTIRSSNNRNEEMNQAIINTEEYQGQFPETAQPQIVLNSYAQSSSGINCVVATPTPEPTPEPTDGK